MIIDFFVFQNQMEIRYNANLKRQENTISEFEKSNILQSAKITELLSNIVSIF